MRGYDPRGIDPGALERIEAALPADFRLQPFDLELTRQLDAGLEPMHSRSSRAGRGSWIRAALMEHRARFQGAAVVSVITGSNADPRLLPRLAG
jgi:hypothetical protein